MGSLLMGVTDFHKKVKEVPDILLDVHNCELFDQVHPVAWTDPSAEKLYDMVVIGAGAGGLVTAGGCGGLGARVALIERHFMGGDCLVSGCVPSKAFIRAANEAYVLRKGGSEFGLAVEGTVKVDFGKMMARLRKLRAKIAENDAAKRFQLKYGVDVFFGEAKYTGKKTVEVNGQTLKFKKSVIATGGRPFVPPVPGLDTVPYYTSETLFNLTSLPPKVVVIGGGPIGCELGQAFARLGSEVTIVDKNEHLLPREDPDAAAILQQQLKDDGVNLRLGASAQKFELLGGGAAGFPRIGVQLGVGAEI